MRIFLLFYYDTMTDRVIERETWNGNGLLGVILGIIITVWVVILIIYAYRQGYFTSESNDTTTTPTTTTIPTSNSTP